MTQDELKLVLETLKWCHGGEPCGTAEAIAVVEKALAQPEQEYDNSAVHLAHCYQGEYPVCKYGDENCPAIPKVKAQQEQEPVAWAVYCDGFIALPSFDSELEARQEMQRRNRKFPHNKRKVKALYDTPPQRTWVGLTNKEVFEICYSNYYRDSQLVKMAEAKLKEKNT